MEDKLLEKELPIKPFLVDKEDFNLEQAIRQAERYISISTAEICDSCELKAGPLEPTEEDMEKWKKKQDKRIERRQRKSRKQERIKKPKQVQKRGLFR